jgi:MFS family permease
MPRYGSPRPEGFFSEDAERAAGSDMALDVECVVDGGVNRQEALGGSVGLVIGSPSMLSIMSLLLYFNLYAQSRDGLGLTPLEAGASLLPLSVALLAVALSASVVANRVGLRNAMTAGMTLIAIASAIIGLANARATLPAIKRARGRKGCAASGAKRCVWREAAGPVAGCVGIC